MTSESLIRRRELRRNSTFAETLLWQQLRNSRCCGLKFKRQHNYGPFILDFYCHELKLCIELDGEVHHSHEAEQYDSQRTAYLNECGITVLRFSNETVVNNMSGLLACIKEYAANPIVLLGYHKDGV